MKENKLIEYLSEYEYFVDDDLGGHYRGIVQYTKDGDISKADTSMSALVIIDSFRELQQESRQQKELLDKIKKEVEPYRNEIMFASVVLEVLDKWSNK